MHLSAKYTVFIIQAPLCQLQGVHTCMHLSTNYTLLIMHAPLYQIHRVHTCMHLSANYTVLLKQKTVILCFPSFPFVSV